MSPGLRLPGASARLSLGSGTGCHRRPLQFTAASRFLAVGPIAQMSVADSALTASGVTGMDPFRQDFPL